MRKLLAGMQISLDGKITGPDGYADWVADWSDHYGVMARVDACLLGAGMYPGYEQYWTAIRDAPDQPLPMTGKLPARAEVDYARFMARTPHYVLSSKLDSKSWAHTSFLRSVNEVRALKERPGKDIYLIGGARIVSSLLDLGLVDELQLEVHPLIAGGGLSLFVASEQRNTLKLSDVRKLQSGNVGMSYMKS